MSVYIVGSQCPDVRNVLNRKFSTDYDLLCTRECWERTKQRNPKYVHSESEYHGVIKNGYILEFDFRPTTQLLLKLLDQWEISDIDLTYMLKMSHRYLKNSPHFEKTMFDIHSLKNAGAKIPKEYREWYKQRKNETYSYVHPSLSQNKDEFFSDQYKYDHDSIHVAIATFKTPAYNCFKVDEAEVQCSREKFNECSFEVKCAAVYEEACVLALERSLIPYDFRPSPDDAFKKALMKVCTSITSGWFRKFAWEHYHTILAIHNRDTTRYVRDFTLGLINGVVKHDHRKEIPSDRDTE